MNVSYHTLSRICSLHSIDVFVTAKVWFLQFKINAIYHTLSQVFSLKYTDLLIAYRSKILNRRIFICNKIFYAKRKIFLKKLFICFYSYYIYFLFENFI